MIFLTNQQLFWDCHGRDRMVVGFITTCAIRAITPEEVGLNPIHGKV
jgi:hypothetical protein